MYQNFQCRVRVVGRLMHGARVFALAAALVIGGLGEAVSAQHVCSCAGVCRVACRLGGSARSSVGVTSVPQNPPGRLLREGQQRRADKGQEAFRAAGPELKLSVGRRVLPRGVRHSENTRPACVFCRCGFLRVSPPHPHADALLSQMHGAPVARAPLSAPLSILRCGYCQLLTPEWEKVAENLKHMVSQSFLGARRAGFFVSLLPLLRQSMHAPADDGRASRTQQCAGTHAQTTRGRTRTNHRRALTLAHARAHTHAMVAGIHCGRRHGTKSECGRQSF